MKTIDTLLEEDYLATTKGKINAAFADAETAIATTLVGDEQASAQRQLQTVKDRLTDVLFEKGIEQHKLSAVRRIAGGRF